MKKILQSLPKILLSLSMVYSSFQARPASAFPEMIRHGYGNCTSCHISPAGGGILTNYGRELGKELLSTWSGEKEHLPLYGAVELPKPLRLGGDFRTVQTYKNTPTYKEGKYFLMQADLDAAWVTDAYTVGGSFGFDPGSPLTDDDDKFVSHRHYLLVPLNKEFSVRVGRFLRNYGLMVPDHTSEIRQGLGWYPGSETYNAEINFQNEQYSLAATAVGGRPDDKEAASEKGVSLLATLLVQSKYRLGANYFYGRTTDQIGRELFGVNWALGFSEKAYLLGELDWVRTAPENEELTEGWVTYLRSGYEIFQGFDLFLVHETRQDDRKQAKLASLRYGPGFQWSPRPHIILSGEWEKQTKPSQSNRASDIAWFVTQFYI